MKKLLSLIVVFFLAISLSAETIRVLTIGNSFSEDAVEQYLYELGHSSGDNFIIGNLFIGGCSLETHNNNANSNAAAYSYRKIVNGHKTVRENFRMSTAIAEEAWDYISFQQVSQNSGQYSSYFPFINNLINYVKARATNPNAKYILHATWAYAQNSDHGGFANYGRNQIQMYNAIVNATRDVVQHTSLDFLVPTGTTIQNARSSTMGDVFCRDGFHLELTYGRFAAACAWYEKLTGKDVRATTYKPASISDFQALVAKHAAHEAVKTPGSITSLANLSDDTEYYPPIKAINISLAGGDAYPEWTGEYPSWNFMEGHLVGSRVSNLKDKEGNITAVSVELTKRFGGVNGNGPTSGQVTPLNFPHAVVKTNFFGNVADFGGQKSPEAELVFRNLNPAYTYSFTMYAGRLGANDNRDTYFKLIGANEKTVNLNTAGNTTNYALAQGVQPKANGEVVMRVGPGAANNNASKFYHLATISLEAQSPQINTVPFSKPIKISFGSSTNAENWNVLWNWMENSNATYLRDVEGDFTTVSATVKARFNDLNPDGPTVTNTKLDMPADISGRAFYGNTGHWAIGPVPKGTIEFANLQPYEEYDLEVFSSRMNATDNRETQFIFSGQTVNDAVVNLNSSNNTSNTARAKKVKADAQGKIRMDVQAGPNNNNSLGFYYLNAMRLAPSSFFVGVEDEIMTTDKVYPNPFNDVLCVELQTNQSKNLDVYSIDGRQVISGQSLNGNSVNYISTDKLSPGYYIVVIDNVKHIAVKM